MASRTAISWFGWPAAIACSTSVSRAVRRGCCTIRARDEDGEAARAAASPWSKACGCLLAPAEVDGGGYVCARSRRSREHGQVEPVTERRRGDRDRERRTTQHVAHLRPRAADRDPVGERLEHHDSVANEVVPPVADGDGDAEPVRPRHAARVEPDPGDMDPPSAERGDRDL